MDPWVPVLVDQTDTWSALGLERSDWVAVGSGLGGALLGALIAGVIAAWLQKLSANHSLQLQTKAAEHVSKQAEDARLASARDNAVRLMMRASLILVDIEATVDALHRQLENANQSGLTGHPLWARVPGFVGSSRAQLFEVTELSPFLDAKEFGIVSRCVELGLQHEVLTESIARYNQARSKLKDVISAEDLGDGLLFTSANRDLLNRISPYTVELDSLISQIKNRSEKQLDRARELNLLIGSAGEKLFGATFPRVNPSKLNID